MKYDKYKVVQYNKKRAELFRYDGQVHRDEASGHQTGEATVTTEAKTQIYRRVPKT